MQKPIDDLHQHRAVGYLNHRTGRTIDWLFSLDDGDCAIRMQETLVVDDTDAYIQAGVPDEPIRVASYLAQPLCRAARWSPVWSRPLLIFPCRWFIRKPAIHAGVRAFYDWSRRVLQPRSARPDVGGIRSAMVRAWPVLSSLSASSAPDPEPAFDAGHKCNSG